MRITSCSKTRTIHYKRKGCGFLEAVYQECLEIELRYQQIPLSAQQELSLTYRDIELKQKYKADVICFDKILTELKAVSKLVDEHRAQVLNYLNATEFKLGLLVNLSVYLNRERYLNSLKRSV